VDLARGTQELPPTDALLISGETIKVVVRPSGTERKLKCYLEAVVPGSVDLVAARAEAKKMLATMRAEMSAALGIPPSGATPKFRRSVSAYWRKL
jgi:phosphomannomutase